MPLNTAVPSERRISDPAPVARTSGTTPRMKAKEVMVMGRSRSRDASTAASARDLPPRCNCWANSTTRMAFLHASPTSTTRPICTKMLTESFVARTPAKAQRRHIGTTRMTASGMRPAFVEGRQGQKDAQHRQGEDEKGGVAGSDLQKHELGPLRAHPRLLRPLGRRFDIA